ncbi:hypothetical protein B484DRAFT_409226 [Ochromonadaceae sp. CCMP2298]|nr:hypothetical protein B484DRAFT_409226 [Ochromonadaceae sp. CCMP2298]
MMLLLLTTAIIRQCFGMNLQTSQTSLLRGQPQPMGSPEKAKTIANMHVRSLEQVEQVKLPATTNTDFFYYEITRMRLATK